jgi:hypothetical protein
VDGVVTALGVWKYSSVVNDEQPSLLHAATFHRYGRPSITDYRDLFPSTDRC